MASDVPAVVVEIEFITESSQFSRPNRIKSLSLSFASSSARGRNTLVLVICLPLGIPCTRLTELHYPGDRVDCDVVSRSLNWTVL